MKEKVTADESRQTMVETAGWAMLLVTTGAIASPLWDAWGPNPVLITLLVVAPVVLGVCWSTLVAKFAHLFC